jgi:anhydro-N-acetylmuramic acid kinase
MTDYYIGLISGTSMDGIDAALVSFDHSGVELHKTVEFNYPPQLRRRLIHAIRNPRECSVDDIGDLDQQVGAAFLAAAQTVISEAGLDSTSILAIGSHGQTLRHQPDADHPFTLQIGDPSVIAAGTGITTVADFRRADMARGGQGAPLAPAFHEFLFRETGIHRVVLNIGGFGNITVLPADHEPASGFDTGPGNTLLDAWIERHLDAAYDSNGEWASSGAVNTELLDRMLADPYFKKPAPKSTGFEYFNLGWLAETGAEDLEPPDVQATLCELTAASIGNAIRSVAPGTAEVFVCGGGVHNAELMRRLAAALPGMTVASTARTGMEPDWVEAATFAWLARRTLDRRTGNLPAVTGARSPAILGAIHPGQKIGNR